MPIPSQTFPKTGADPSLFWAINKTRIIGGAAALVVILVGLAVYEELSEKNVLGSQAAFATAHTEQDYRSLISQYPKTDAAGNAMLLLASKLRDQKKFDESDSTINEFITRFPYHPLISGAYLSLATNYELEGKTEQAIEAYKDVSSRYADSFASPAAMLGEANLLRAQGKTDEARRTYENINSQYPESLFSREALNELRFFRK